MSLTNRLIKASLILLSASAFSLSSNGQSKATGYYKDLFMDSGIYLTSRIDLPAARYLGLSMEEFVSTNHKDKTLAMTAADTLFQNSFIAGSPVDENGALLYPDGAPRFRAYYMNGGRAGTHGRSLGEEARERIREYVANGGSYVGTCAGAFFASKGTFSDSVEYYKTYAGIFPGLTRSTRLENSYTDMDIEPKSPLLKYYDFGGDMKIDSVRHNGGCFGYTGLMFPKKTEILARYQTGDREMKRVITGEPSIWAYKDSDQSGRVICCGSHPEGVVYGERLQLMSAMLRYAMDGNGKTPVKAELKDGEVMDMTKWTSAGDPAHTAIGDKQYHHFTIEVPAKTDSLTITLKPKKGYNDYDLYIYARSNDFAFNDTAEYANVQQGVDKTLVIYKPAKGTMYISVFCDTTVEASQTKWGTQYSGRLDVLNGVPYTLEVSFGK